MQGLEQNMSSLEDHDLVSALSCLQCFGLSKDSDLFTLITLRIIEKMNTLQLKDASAILGVIRLVDNENKDVLVNELLQELKAKVQNVLSKKLHSLKESELISILNFIRSDYCDMPDEVIIKLLNSCFSKF